MLEFSDLGLSTGLTEDQLLVEYANQGQRGVEIAKRAIEHGNRFLVAFIDMRMPPGMDGLQTAKALRQIDPHIFIVIVTAYSDVSINQIKKELGSGVLYLAKPFVNQELLQIIELFKQIREEHPLTECPIMPGVTHEREMPDPLIDDYLMGIFYKTVAEKRDRLLLALESYEWDEIRTIAHNLKGSAATFGFSKLSELGALTQTAIDQDKRDDALVEARRLLNSLEKIGKELP